MLNLKQINDNYIYIDINKIDSINLCTNSYDSSEYYVTVDMILNEEQLNKIISHNKFNLCERKP